MRLLPFFTFYGGKYRAGKHLMDGTEGRQKPNHARMELIYRQQGES